MLFCVPGDGSNNSGGVMGTKNWIWGEISGGVGVGGPGGCQAGHDEDCENVLAPAQRFQVNSC